MKSLQKPKQQLPQTSPLWRLLRNKPTILPPVPIRRELTSRNCLNLDEPIISFSGKKGDAWTVRDSFEGLQVFGGTGSGKSTGSGEAVLLRMLQLGYGGLILTVKSEERREWADPVNGYCARAGRLSDLLIFGADGEHKFDFLKYESERTGPGSGSTLELARLFSTVLESNGSASDRSSDPYWPRAVNQLVTNTIDFTKLTTGSVSLRDMATIIRECPKNIREAEKKVSWKTWVKEASKNAKTERQKFDLDLTLDYFNRELPRLNSRTRSSIISMFTSMADVLLRGTVGELYSGGSYTFTPECTDDGKLILIDLPVQVFGETGRFAQTVFKYIWQKAAERRDKTKPMRPMFLWCDESQELITSYDAAFQSTARSSAVATVCLTQNIRNYHARLGGGAKAEADTDSLLGNLGTKIFHANGDPTTNQWAERIFGYTSTRRTGGSVSRGDVTANWNESTEPTIPAKKFTMLRKGATRDSRKIEGIVFQMGRVWEATQDNYVKAVFEQAQQ